jgi:hypothetical protein
MMETPNATKHRGFPSTASAFGLMILTLWGCNPGVKLVPVSGRVLLDGRPLGSGSVMLQPKVGPAARSQIGADGTFELGTYNPRDGVRPGPAAVRVTSVAAVQVAPDQEQPAGKSLIPLRYADFATSGITVEVVDGMQPVEIELSSR